MKLKRKDQKGFTIVEVLIVLAIAALIMLVVFFAVPALQRAQRNNARKTDVNRIAASAINFVSNNNGQLPSTTNHVTTILTETGDFAGYPATLAVASPLGTPASNRVALLAQGGTPTTPIGTSVIDGLRIITGGVCDSTVSGQVTQSGASARSMAIQYVLEVSQTASSPQCQNIQ